VSGSFKARPIPFGQPWSCVFKLKARVGEPVLDLTGAELICTFRTALGATSELLKVSGVAITLLASDELRLQLTGQQTRKLPVGSVVFAIGRKDGGLRDITPPIVWPVRVPINQEVP
jgi:hypothetical protein